MSEREHYEKYKNKIGKELVPGYMDSVDLPPGKSMYCGFCDELAVVAFLLSQRQLHASTAIVEYRFPCCKKCAEELRTILKGE